MIYNLHLVLMKNINIKATNMDLTDAIREYVEKRLEATEKFFKETEPTIYIELGKTTKHHKSGDFFKAEFNITVAGINYYTVAEEADLYEAIDEAKEEIIRQIKDKKNRKQTLFKRGATSIKKMIKGISKRNPFTSKY
jgi:putative sigma-54 modulation protein